MRKKLLALLLAAAMVVCAAPTAFAHGGHGFHGSRTAETCPVCGIALRYRACRDVENCELGFCPQHGEVALSVAEESAPTSHNWTTNYRNGSAQCSICGQFAATADAVCPGRRSVECRHSWTTEFPSGDAVCSVCGETRAADGECALAPAFHRWTTDYLSGAAQCSLCGFYWLKPLDEPLSQEDATCPNHKTFHVWTTDEATGEPICENCGHRIAD